ncbi:MAG: Uma2 family endonuclease [Atopobiaceae bacterium]|nr:Uma2 family endonuclease [Atopobiaceae bacterium]
MPLLKPYSTATDYCNLPEGVRAELIDGELWNLASPSRIHQKIVYELGRCLGDYIDRHDGSCEVYPGPFAVNLFADESTFVEPDISVVCDSSKLSERGCEGAPDFIAEVTSPSNSGMDYISKLHLYRDAGVREYWICDPQKRQVIAYRFDEEPVATVYKFDDEVQSSLFEGFSICFAQVVR